MEYDDLCIRTVWVVLDFETNARKIFRVPQRYNVAPEGIRPGVRVTGLNEYTIFEDFAADAPISVKLDVANDVGRRRSAVPIRPTILSGSNTHRR
jgi:hypothetical protein